MFYAPVAFALVALSLFLVFAISSGFDRCCFPALSCFDTMGAFQHYYEAHVFLKKAIHHVAGAFGVDTERVIPLQLRPDERAPTTVTIWTFT